MRLLLLLFNSLLFFSFVYASIHITISNETLEDRSSNFGPSISVNDKLGFLIPPTQDIQGCSLVTKPCTTDWIALVERGGCSFITKVRYMQKSGASAVVVGDPKNPGWITMYAPGDTSDIFIPSVFLAKQEYTRILHLLKLLKSTGTDPMMIVLQQDENNHHVIWPLMDVFIIVVLSPCIMLLLIYLSWKIRSRTLQKRELAPSSVVSNLSIKIFKQSEKPQQDIEALDEEEEPESCAICLEDYSIGDELRILPCGHVYHTTCVDGWLLTRKKVCPICKMDVTITKGDTTKRSQDEEITPLLLV